MPPKKHKRKIKPKALLAWTSKPKPSSCVHHLPPTQPSPNINVIDHTEVSLPVTGTGTSPTGNVNVLPTLSPSVTVDHAVQVSVIDANATTTADASMTTAEEISAVLLSLPVLSTTVLGTSTVQPEVLADLSTPFKLLYQQWPKCGQSKLPRLQLPQKIMLWFEIWARLENNFTSPICKRGTIADAEIPCLAGTTSSTLHAEFEHYLAKKDQSEWPPTSGWCRKIENFELEVQFDRARRALFNGVLRFLICLNKTGRNETPNMYSRWLSPLESVPTPDSILC
jgi:hypothetical protein